MYLLYQIRYVDILDIFKTMIQSASMLSSRIRAQFFEKLDNSDGK